ncbi:hypothetical protein ACFV3R_33490 [Streptomyces sp. NPDC059740]|uniref:hypothetical protein n=1 Tax=Streptomyces sp. NPDC059740 TaxID=3346926 RepID=UPI00364FD3FD
MGRAWGRSVGEAPAARFAILPAVRHLALGRHLLSAAGRPPSGRRHPLVALAMAVPPALLLAFVFGGWDAVLTQASSVAGRLGR